MIRSISAKHDFTGDDMTTRKKYFITFEEEAATMVVIGPISTENNMMISKNSFQSIDFLY